jgi:peptidoglycan/LPS O-acetylase OafA/YrhL
MPGLTQSAHGAYLGRRYFSALDGLRSLAIVPVIWHHSTPRPLPGLLGKGPAGVDLFFCISGFLITTLLLREKSRTGGVALADFYARRALRILPLYYAVLLAYAAFAWALPDSAPQRAHFLLTLPYYATFTANWFADFGVRYPILFAFAWSLCVEEQFYAFWPVLVRALSRRAALLAMLLVLSCDAAAERGWLGFALPAGGPALRIVTSFAAPIGLGALLALALDSPRGFALLARGLAQWWSAPLSLLTALALLAWPSAPLLGFQLALTALVGACVVRARSGLAPLLEARAMSYVGRVSYALYLLNLTAIGLVRRAFPERASSPLFVFALSLPLALGLAALSQRYLEAPLLSRRARFRRGPLSDPGLAQRSSTKSA